MSIRKFVSYGLKAIGALIALLSGSCSLAIIGPALLNGRLGNGLGIVTFFGGIPFVFGLFLVLIGEVMRPRKESLEFDRMGYVTEDDKPKHMTEEQKQAELAKMKENEEKFPDDR